MKKSFWVIINLILLPNLSKAESSLFGLPESISNKIPSSLKSAVEKSTGDLFSKVLNQVTQSSDIGMLQDLGQVKKLMPIVDFATNLPVGLTTAFLNTANYMDNIFSIVNAQADGATTLSYDLQSKGSGNVSLPFGYLLVSGAYTYNPALGILTRTYTDTTVASEIFDLQEMVNQAAKTYKLLSSVVKVLPDGQSILDSATRMFCLLPQDMFLCKCILLVATSYRNINEPNAYPTIAHLSLELALLLKRLSLTPDYVATMKAHNAITTSMRSSDWQRDKIVYFDQGPQAIFAQMPAALRTFINQVEVETDTEQADLAKAGIFPSLSQMRKIYAQCRQNSSYTQSTKLIREQLLAENSEIALRFKSDFFPFEKLLWFCVIIRHTQDRYAGFLPFLQQSLASIIKDANSVVAIDVAPLLVTLNNRANDLSSLLEQFLQFYSALTQEQASMQQDILAKIKDWKVRIIDEQGQIAKYIQNILLAQMEQKGSDVASKAAAIKSSLESLQQYVTQSQQNDLDEPWYQTVISDRTQTLVKFEEFLGIKYHLFQQMIATRFRGDMDFYFDDSYLGLTDAFLQATAIILRLSEDAQKAEAIFKLDTNTYKMNDPKGKQVSIVPQTVYREKVLQNDELIFAQKKKVELAKNKLVKTNTPANNTAYQSEVQKLQELEKTLALMRWEFMNYLRQYAFDRRNLIAVKIKSADLSSLSSSVNVVNLEETAIQERLKSKVSKESLFDLPVYAQIAWNIFSALSQELQRIYDEQKGWLTEQLKIKVSEIQAKKTQAQQIIDTIETQKKGLSSQNANSQALSDEQKTSYEKNLATFDTQASQAKELLTNFDNQLTTLVLQQDGLKLASEALLKLNSEAKKIFDSALSQKKLALNDLARTTLRDKLKLVADQLNNKDAQLTDSIFDALQTLMVGLKEVAAVPMANQSAVTKSTNKSTQTVVSAPVQASSDLLAILRQLVFYINYLAMQRQVQAISSGYFASQAGVSEYTVVNVAEQDKPLLNKRSYELSAWACNKVDFSLVAPYLSRLAAIKTSEQLKQIFDKPKGLNDPDVITMLNPEPQVQVVVSESVDIAASLQALKASSAPVDTTKNTVSANSQIVVHADLGYANTLDGFAQEEFKNLEYRCPEFGQYANSYLDTVLLQMCGRSYSELVKSGTQANYREELFLNDLLTAQQQADLKKNVVDVAQDAQSGDSNFSDSSSSHVDVESFLKNAAPIVAELPFSSSVTQVGNMSGVSAGDTVIIKSESGVIDVSEPEKQAVQPSTSSSSGALTLAQQRAAAAAAQQVVTRVSTTGSRDIGMD